MALDPKKWTTKTQEAVAAAVDSARQRENPQITPDHLLAALAEQEGTVAIALLSKLGQPPQMVRNRAIAIIDKLPRAHGGDEPRMDRDLNAMFGDADGHRRDLHDEYLSV